jgi:RNA polymerase sigma-70 factor (ECF subfamily)
MQRKDDLNLAEIQSAASGRHPDALVRGTAKRSQRDFQMLVKTCSPKIYGVLLTMLRDREQARDALQVTFARIWLRAETFDPDRGSAETWMIQIARNHAIDLLRQRKRRAEVQPDDRFEVVDLAPTVESQLEIRDDMKKVLECLGKIDPKKAQAIRLAYIQGLSYADLAEKMGKPLNTIRTWLRRGLVALRDCVDG